MPPSSTSSRLRRISRRWAISPRASCVAAAFQGLWIRWLLAGPSQRTIAIGIVGNLAIVIAWAWTRTVGLPVGPFAGGAEPIGYPDAASVAFELLLVAGLVARWFGSMPGLGRSAAARSVASVAVVPVLGLVLVLTSLATVAIARPRPRRVGKPPGGCPSRPGARRRALTPSPASAQARARAVR